jgi:hypothetical protein
MTERVVVLGCGPAGLIAAERAEREGQGVAIMARKMKSVMPGAQYLHEFIPGVTRQEPTGYVCLKKRGTRPGYASKVYGDAEHPVSWDNYSEGYVPAWSLGDAYERLWNKWEDKIIDVQLDRSMIQTLAGEKGVLILSTIPAPILCRGGCKFNSAEVYFSGRPQPRVPDNTIVYNGDPLDLWYRTSVIFGHGATEWAREPGHVPVQMGRKPTHTDCECQPRRVVRLGRFGSWDKNFLVHHAWERTASALHEMQ